jgi:hypothetical protein
MSIRFDLYENAQILNMSDDELLTEIKKMRAVISQLRKSQRDTRVAEEEISYLQAELQNRGFAD